VLRPERVVTRPTATTVYDSVEGFVVPSDALYIAATSGEERSQHIVDLQSRSPGAVFLEIIGQSRASFGLVDGREVALRSASELDSFWKGIGSGRQCFVDITGLTHSVWASLLASALRRHIEVEAVYVEPLRYKENQLADPSRDLFDLTVAFEGLAPLPGFASLQDPPEDEFWFIPLLGFEGRRFSYMRDQVAPLGGHTIPVIGVPGFQPEFVNFAYHGNEAPLLDDEAWHHVVYATANCPFSAFDLLIDIRERLAGGFMKIATIGTKPHSLGAVLFALAHPDSAEILYDHPQRKKERTYGQARLLVYHLHAFDPAQRAGTLAELA
jgi:hypothetical protein